MSNELNEKAQQLADTTSAYELARRLIEAEQEREEKRRLFVAACEVLGSISEKLGLEEDEDPDTIVSVLEGKLEDRDKLRGCFHSACEELTTLKAALVDEGDEVPVGPALSLVSELKAERDALQRLADCRAEQRGALVAQVERLRGLSIRIYNTGYGVGHNDTVEGGYTDIHHSDMDSYHAEEVAELLLDLEVPSLTSARPGQPEGSAWSGWCCQYPGKMPRLYGSREIAELNHDPDNGDRLFQVVELRQAKEGAPS